MNHLNVYLYFTDKFFPISTEIPIPMSYELLTSYKENVRFPNLSYKIAKLFLINHMNSNKCVTHVIQQLDSGAIKLSM